MAESYSGPYRKLRREPKILLLQIGDRQEWVSADRLKPHTGADGVQVNPNLRFVSGGGLCGGGGYGKSATEFM